MTTNFSVHWMPDVQVEYEYIKGENHRITPKTITPPSPPLITKLKVTITKSNKTVDLTDVLPTEIIQEIMDALIVDIVNGGTIDRDDYDEAFRDVSDG